MFNFDSDEKRKPLQVKDCLKWVCIDSDEERKPLQEKIVSSEYVCCLIYPCPYWGQSIFVTVGRYIVSNQLIAGSIMVRHMKLILVLSLPLRVYYIMRCTHNSLWGVIMNSSDSTWSYFGCISCFWQDLQDLTFLDGMCICFQYFTDFDVSLRLEGLGCWR